MLTLGTRDLTTVEEVEEGTGAGVARGAGGRETSFEKTESCGFIENIKNHYI